MNCKPSIAEAPTPKREKEIPNTLARLGLTISNLDKTTDQLGQTLSAILSEDRSGEVTEPPLKAPSTTCPLAITLSNLNDQLATILRRVDYMNRQIEL